MISPGTWAPSPTLPAAWAKEKRKGEWHLDGGMLWPEVALTHHLGEVWLQGPAVCRGRMGGGLGACP